jgi:tetratricopeptide (TPR) repeat protein
MARFSDKLKQESEGMPPLKMRAGIHTGPVVVGTLGNDLRVEFKAVGDTVNMASRMERLAEPGATCVTEDTFKLTEGLFRFEALGEREVKGKDEPINVYRVIAPSTRRTRFDVSAERGLTPFVGRERELELLLDGFERSKAARGQGFSIMAEAGVGKSRLLYEFRKRVSNEDVTFLEGKCLSYSRGVAYHPVIDILKSNFDIQGGDGDLAIREKVKRGLNILEADEDSTLPYLLELLLVKDSGIDKIPMGSEARKERILEALNRIVLKGSEIRPLIMAIEDLHWVDKSSEETLKSLLDSIAGARVFLIFTCRPEFVHTWGGRSYHSQVNLNRLSNRESLAMAGQLLGTEDMDSGLEEFILEKTEGVPLFIEEFITSLKNLRIIERKDKRYRIAKDVQTMTIPATINDVIMARVDSLSEGAKVLLKTGSVVGREFGHDLIERVTGLSENELLADLSALKDSELLYERGIYPQSSYIFKHALTQEVVYNSLLLKKRKELHEKTGKAIEEIYPERLEEYYEMLAYHYSKSENPEKACHYLVLSGKKAARSHSIWEAFRYYKEALELLRKSLETEETKREWIEIVLLMITPIRLLGYPKDSLQILQEGERLSKELGDERSLANVYNEMGNFFSLTGNPKLGGEYLETSYEQARKRNDIDLIAPFGLELCFFYFTSGEFVKGDDLARSVLDLLEKSDKKYEFFGSPAHVYSALCGLCGCLAGYLGNFEEGELICKKGLQIATEIGDLRTLAHCNMWYGVLFLLKHDGKHAIGPLKKSIGYFEKVKWIFAHAASLSWVGFAHHLLGETEIGRKYLQEGIRMLVDARIKWALGQYYIYLGRIQFDQGDLTNARTSFEKALKLSQKFNAQDFVAQSRVLIGRTLGKVNPSQSEVAEEMILQGIRIFDQLKSKPYLALAYVYLAELYADTGRGDGAMEKLKKAEEMFQEMGMDYGLARTQEVLARL